MTKLAVVCRDMARVVGSDEMHNELLKMANEYEVALAAHKQSHGLN
ncbi:hypothetical protein [Sphingomonas xinjiangensis]|uniref:Uncharacterized protein n=1 Tax=Sphingomonas xinjiangensis TaxID=643568 RepID=A0A840YA15_9SPHN|nr:hypothetical protein [Sphingomonas xinjiangensis]MBB5709684.1 hypothetical protein [Sphingomonas xinjiangensis]